jgi:BirA family biotin operon repressor/biotin-[acetyl-CoA-carboxylase] ligase
MERSESTADSASIRNPQSAIRNSEVWHLDTRRLGRQVLVFERVESTNDVAAALAGDRGEGVVVLADEQSAGRGQYGRSWLAPPRSSVLLSVLLMPPPPLSRPAVLTAWAAVAVCSVVEDLVGLAPRIKWPNDVLLQGRKVCGILIEQGGGARQPATVAGIGLNVGQGAAELLAAGLPEATSLSQCTARPLATHTVARQLICRLDEDYDRLCGGDLAGLEECWRRYLDLLGRSVRAECHGGTYNGRLRELSFAGLALERVGTAPLLLQPETVLHLDADE